MNENDEFKKLMNELFGETSDPDPSESDPMNDVSEAMDFINQAMAKIAAAQVVAQQTAIAHDTTMNDQEKVEKMLQVVIEYGNKRYEEGKAAR
jgi:hypothetical protein